MIKNSFLLQVDCKILYVLNMVFFSFFSSTAFAYKDSLSYWEPAIKRFEKLDKKSPPPQEAIVFTGSSSIRLWKTLEADMQPLPVINRGFGGSKIAYVTHYADRIVIPYRPKIVLLYAGDNDLAMEDSKTPMELLEDFKQFVAKIHSALPLTKIFFVSIKPSVRRWLLWPKVQETNQLIKEWTQSDERIGFIDVTTMMLDEDGKVKSTLFTQDGLHLNQQGYTVWSSVIKPIVEKAFVPTD